MDFINNSILLAGVEIGTHYYWEIAGFSLHGQVFIVSWVVIGLLLTAAFLGASDPKRIPESWRGHWEIRLSPIFPVKWMVKWNMGGRRSQKYKEVESDNKGTRWKENNFEIDREIIYVFECRVISA